MNQDVEIRQTKQEPAVVFKAQVQKTEHEFRAALPAHIPVERYMRVVNTAVVNNPALLDADRKSLFEAAMKAAQDGLLPDGREGALVIYGKKVQWLPMIAGILKKVRNSGELLSIASHVAYSNDEFTYELGDDEAIKHRPSLDDRGKPRLVYAIARTKDGGIYREIMTVAEVEKVRSISKAPNSVGWASFWDEMARKSVLKRLSKRLPMSSDLDDLIHRDDHHYGFQGPQETAVPLPHPRTLERTLDALAGNGEPPHDPETGEVRTTESEHRTMLAGDSAETTAALADPTGEEAGRQLKAKLDERAAPGVVAEAQLQALLDAGRAAATNGWAEFKKWRDRLSAPYFERVSPHLDEMAKAAQAVDGERK